MSQAKSSASRFAIGPHLPRAGRSFRHQVFRSQTGASLVEYAFVAVIFLSLIFGISGFGHALFAYHYLNEVAKEATRYAAVRGANCSGDGSCVAANSATSTAGPTSQADVQAYVASITPQSIDATQVTATATWPGPASPPICFNSVTLKDGTVVPKLPDKSPGCTVQVQVQYTYNFIFPWVTSSAINMSTTSEMVIAH